MDTPVAGVRRPIPSWVIALLAILPVLVAVVRALVNHWTPLGDDGLIMLRADDVITSNHPLLGTWTSASLTAGVNFNNPGPLLFDAFAVFVKPFGVSVGGPLAVGALNGASILVAVRFARLARGRLGEWAMALGALALSWTLGSEMLVDPWQPHSLVFAFLAFVSACMAAAAGHRRALPWAVGIGSLLVQSHLSYVVVVGLLALVGAAMCWFNRQQPIGAQPSPRRSIGLALGVTILCWAQPVVEMFTGPGQGNLARLASNSSSSEVKIGPRLGVRLVSQVIALPDWWLRPSFQQAIPPTPFTGPAANGVVIVASLPTVGVALLSLAVVALATTGLLWLLVQRGFTAHVAAGAISAASIAAAVATMLVMPIGALGLAPHQMRWLWPISICWWFWVGSTVVALIRVPVVTGRRRGEWAALVAAAIGVALCIPAYTTDAGPFAQRQASATVRSMIDQLQHVTLPGPTLFDVTNLRFAEPYSGPLLATLLGEGQPLRLSDEGFIRQLGEGRRASGTEGSRLVLREGAGALEAVGDEQRIVFVDGLTPAQSAELIDLEGRADDPDAAAKAQALRDRRNGLSMAVFVSPIG